MGASRARSNSQRLLHLPYIKICGHGKAYSADHLIPVTENSRLSMSVDNLKAVHGYSRKHPGGCPVCTAASVARGGKPVFCNDLRQAMSISRVRRIIRERTGLLMPGDSELETAEEEKPEGRPW